MIVIGFALRKAVPVRPLRLEDALVPLASLPGTLLPDDLLPEEPVDGLDHRPGAHGPPQLRQLGGSAVGTQPTALRAGILLKKARLGIHVQGAAALRRFEVGEPCRF